MFSDDQRACLHWIASHPVPSGEEFQFAVEGLAGGRQYVAAIATMSLNGGISAISNAAVVRTLVPTSPARPPFPPSLARGTLEQASRRLEATGSSRLVLNGAEPAAPLSAPGLAMVAGGGHVWLSVAKTGSGGLPVTH